MNQSEINQLDRHCAKIRIYERIEQAVEPVVRYGGWAVCLAAVAFMLWLGLALDPYLYPECR